MEFQNISSDRGPNFLSELMQEVCRLLSTTKVNTSGYHPQCDGLVEKFNNTLINMLAKSVNKYGHDCCHTFYLHMKLQCKNRHKSHRFKCSMAESQCYHTNKHSISQEPSIKYILANRKNSTKKNFSAGHTVVFCGTPHKICGTCFAERKSTRKKPPPML